MFAKRGKRRNNLNRRDAVSSGLLQSVKGVGSAEVVRIGEDITRRNPNMNIIQKPPRNYFSSIHWFKESSQTYTITTNAISLVENNYVITISQFPASSAIRSLYDQYCIYEVVMVITAVNINTATTSSENINLLTAIDYDNINTLAAISGIQQFASYNSAWLTPSNQIERLCKPCVAPYVTRTGGVVAGSGIARSWIDSGYDDVSHYGFRTMLPPTSTANLQLQVAFTAIIGARNTI